MTLYLVSFYQYVPKISQNFSKTVLNILNFASIFQPSRSFVWVSELFACLYCQPEYLCTVQIAS